jgi:energy-coupling factor transporter ATP-binding protein EcfA2
MTVQDQIFEWVQAFDAWKQELFIRAAAAPEIAEGDAEEIAAMLLGEQREGARPREVSREHLPAAEGGDEPMVIHRICELRNVNAIEDGQALAFQLRGVNVVWGANGAGKTGYSRVLKHAGRTLYPEGVLTNVNADDGGAPQATIVVAIGQDERSIGLDLTAAAPAMLGRICVADAKAGEIYLTKETAVDYVPITLASLSRLATGLDAVKKVLQERRDAVEVAEIDSRAFGDETSASRLVAGLVATTPEEDVRALAKLSDAELSQRSALRKRVGEVEAMQAPQLRAAAQREATEVTRLAADLTALSGPLGEAALEQARELERALREARDAADLAARRFEQQPLGEVGSQPWRVLWEAAREYANHLGQALPPDHDPAHCPLCMQELGPEARNRLREFEQFVVDDVNAHLLRLQGEREQAVGRLPDVGAVRDRHRGAVELLGAEQDDLGSAVGAWLDLAASSLDRLRRGELEGLAPVSSPPDLSSWIDARRAEAERQAEIESGEENEKARHDLAQLNGRHLLAKRLDEVLGRLGALREVARLEKAMGETPTNKVSRKISVFSEELIKAGLEEALNKQLRALEIHDIEVEPTTRTVRGQPVTGLRFKTVENVPLTDVLSQGEQRRLALAMFLAEMEVRSDSSPVVFDDPTSSIDQEGRRLIARSLLKLGKNRQVIVFTHELSLVLELQRHAPTGVEVSAQHVRRIGKTVGHVHPDLPWGGLSPRERLGDLDQRLVGICKIYEGRDEEAYAPQAGHFCKLLRDSFERAVEDGVLGGVIRRRTDDVRTKQLRTINWSEEICDLVDRGMSENSPWVHDQPLADGASPPNPDELREGLKIYAELLNKIGALKKSRESEAGKRKQVRTAKLKAVESVEGDDGQPSPGLKPVPEPRESDPDITPASDQDTRIGKVVDPD